MLPELTPRTVYLTYTYVEIQRIYILYFDMFGVKELQGLNRGRRHTTTLSLGNRKINTITAHKQENNSP